MSCVMTRISPMRAPSASSSAKLGTRSSGRGSCAPALTHSAPSAARQTSRYCLIAAEHRLGLREERVQEVVHGEVVLLLEARVRDACHHGELLVGIGQETKELHHVVERRD